MNKQPTTLVQQLIVTRPKDQAEQLIAKLNAVIDDTIIIKHIPLLQIVPINFQSIEQNGFDAVIFISGNAAKYFFAEQPSVFAEQQPPIGLFAVGENTAEQVEKLTQQKVIFPQQMNAEGLLGLNQLQQVKGQNWLIVKGEAGRSLIYQELVKRGAKVTELDVYQRKLPDLHSQQQIYQASLDNPVWIISSAEALNHLYRILGLAEKAAHQTPLIVSSDRLKSLAMQKGFKIIGQSQGASELQLVDYVKELIQNQKNTA